MAHVPDCQRVLAAIDDQQIHPPGRAAAHGWQVGRARADDGHCAVQPSDLPPIDALLGWPERFAAGAPHLDTHQLIRPWIDGDDVNLVVTDLQIASDDRPAELGQVRSRKVLAGGTATLSGGLHAANDGARDVPAA